VSYQIQELFEVPTSSSEVDRRVRGDAGGLVLARDFRSLFGAAAGGAVELLQSGALKRHQLGFRPFPFSNSPVKWFTEPFRLGKTLSI
jgi:hypothetical protein